MSDNLDFQKLTGGYLLSNFSHLIKGAYDLHVHSAPDVMPRKLDDMDMAKRIKDSGMAGFAMKSHYFCTAERAKMINTMHGSDCHAIGTIVLNHAVGGINPNAVEMAGRSDNKLVWFPTLDSAHGRADVFSGKPLDKLPFWAKILMEMREEGIETEPINILDQNDKLIAPVYDVLDIIAKYNMALVTGNLSKKEAKVLVKEAHARKVQKIIIALVDFPSIAYTVEEQQEFTKYGAYMEHCYNTWSSGKVDVNESIHQIKSIGADNVILSTDLGQSKGIYPDEGMLAYATKLVEAGVSEEDVIKMTVHNPKWLIS